MPVATNTAVATYNFYTSHKTAAILNSGRLSEKRPQIRDFYINPRNFGPRRGLLARGDLSLRPFRGFRGGIADSADQALRSFVRENVDFRLIVASIGTFPACGGETVYLNARNVQDLRQILPISPKHFHHVLRWRLLLHILKPKVACLRNPASSF